MLTTLLEAIAPVPTHGTATAQEHLDNLTKPPGSLGRLEELALRLAPVRGEAPSVAAPVIFTFAADHGVAAEGVSAYPQTVTAQMVENFLRGGAAVNVLARQAGARVVVADFGVVNPVAPAEALVPADRARNEEHRRGPAMSRAQALAAIDAVVPSTGWLEAPAESSQGPRRSILIVLNLRRTDDADAGGFIAYKAPRRGQ